jgi:hypothetical protein
MSTQIKITRRQAGPPKGGFAGAFTGGTEDGLVEVVELVTAEEGDGSIGLVALATQAFIDAFSTPAEIVELKATEEN